MVSSTKPQRVTARCIKRSCFRHCAHHEAKGIDKSKIKLEIRALKKEREEALGSHNSEKLRDVRSKLHDLKKKLRKAIV